MGLFDSLGFGGDVTNIDSGMSSLWDNSFGKLDPFNLDPGDSLSQLFGGDDEDEDTSAVEQPMSLAALLAEYMASMNPPDLEPYTGTTALPTPAKVRLTPDEQRILAKSNQMVLAPGSQNNQL